jgi:hypothetical protein
MQVSSKSMSSSSSSSACFRAGLPVQVRFTGGPSHKPTRKNNNHRIVPGLISKCMREFALHDAPRLAICEGAVAPSYFRLTLTSAGS